MSEAFALGLIVGLVVGALPFLVLLHAAKKFIRHLQTQLERSNDFNASIMQQMDELRRNVT